MTIGISTTRVSYTCDGVTTAFPVPIQAYQDSDFLVLLTAPAAAGGASTTLVLDSAYTLTTSGSLNPPQWTLTSIGILSPYPTGYSLQIILNPVESQQAQLVQGQAFPYTAVQEALDRNVQMSQRLSDQVSRALRAPDGDASVSGFLLPAAAARVAGWLGFDSNGQPTVLHVSPSIGTGLSQLYGGTDTGAVNAYLLTPVPALSAYAEGDWISWWVSNTNTGASTVNVSGLGVVPIVNPDGSALIANQLFAGQPASMVYKGGKFYLPALIAVSPLLNAQGLNVTGAGAPANGWFLPAANTLGWATNGVQRGSVSPTGDVITRGVAVCKFKPTGTSRPTQTVPSNDPDLTYAIPGAGTYAFELYINCGATGASNGGIALNCNFSGTITCGYFATTTSFQGVKTTANQNVSSGTNVSTQAGAAMTNSSPNTNSAADFIIVRGVLVCSTGGTFAFGWSQNTSSANPTWLDKGSFLQVTQLS